LPNGLPRRDILFNALIVSFNPKLPDNPAVPGREYALQISLKFYDEAKIFIRSGDGGQGCVSFLRERFKPYGGPNGGDGGKGGDVLITASVRCHSLEDYHYRQHFKAPHGGHGQGNERNGRKGQDLQLIVPLGTMIREAENGLLLADLTTDGQTFLAAQGGRGGKGNKHFATATRRTPKFAQKGEPGFETWLILELKVLAHIGLVGLPNAGKSTLLSQLSAAKPKISDYPFTTLSPNLGILENDHGQRLTIADIPGIIEGASQGAGLGLKFLKHIERTLILVFLLDGSIPGKGPYLSYQTLIKEMAAYNPALLDKPRLVVLNKIDLPKAQGHFSEIKKAFKKDRMEIIPLSAKTGEGLASLIDFLFIRTGIQHEGKGEQVD
jgi:GTP-binding protein